ncbi:F-box domain-containing protein [Mycena sanguinolenta]|uniref:F-box domain-containing protein n=1 Tax=Mycena sanguinolenta TaxID=230812 RepID=A0A8H7CWY9_9AGAR|nr:F-box domain-containing protein [Mycena sanguinolenta]
MPFEALGEDVLLRIFCFCDISTVLAVSAINKGLRFIALSKQLWLSLVLDPRFRDALDLPPPNREKLECLSTEELITVVKDAVTGPCSIGDSEHDESSVILTSVQIPLDDMEYLPFVRLLPGARYLLLHSISTTQQRLCIYDFWSARCVWERLEQAHTMCEVDLVPGGAIARVCLVQPGHLPNTQKVHIEELGLTTGASHELFAVSFTGTIKFGTLCAIVGDFLLGTVLHSHSHFGEAQLVLLIDWRTSTFVSLGRMAPHNNVQLIPGYILSTYQETSTPPVHNLVLTALEAFSDRWQPLTANHILLAAQLEAGYAPGTIPIKNHTPGEAGIQSSAARIGLHHSHTRRTARRRIQHFCSWPLFSRAPAQTLDTFGKDRQSENYDRATGEGLPRACSGASGVQIHIGTGTSNQQVATGFRTMCR